MRAGSKPAYSAAGKMSRKSFDLPTASPTAVQLRDHDGRLSITLKDTILHLFAYLGEVDDKSQNERLRPEGFPFRALEDFFPALAFLEFGNSGRCVSAAMAKALFRAGLTEKEAVSD